MGDNELRPVVTTARYQNSTVEDAVIVPGLQAFLTALPIGILAGVLAPVVNFPSNGFLVALIVFLAAFIAAWFRFSGWWNSLVESVLLIDLNRDGFIGEPPAPKLPELPVRMIEDPNHSAQFDLPYPAKAVQVAQGLMRGEELSGRTWAGKDKLFTDSEWESFTAELRKRDMATWRNGAAHQQGMILTAKGRALFKELSKMERGSMTIFQPQNTLDGMNVNAVEVEPTSPLPRRKW